MDTSAHLQRWITEAAGHKIVIEAVVAAVDEAAAVELVVDVDVVTVGRRREVGDVVAEIGALNLQEVEKL